MGNKSKPNLVTHLVLPIVAAFIAGVAVHYYAQRDVQYAQRDVQYAQRDAQYAQRDAQYVIVELLASRFDSVDENMQFEQALSAIYEETEQLQARIDVLENEVDVLKSEVANLENENESLRNMYSTTPTNNGTDPPPPRATRLRDMTSNREPFFNSDITTDNYRSREYTDVLRIGLRRFQFTTLLNSRYTRLRGTLFVPYGAQDQGGHLTITFELDDSVVREPEVHKMYYDTHPIEIDIELTGVDKLSISTNGIGAPWVQFAYFRLYP